MEEEKKRTLANWSDSFVDYTKGIQSPEIYRRWTSYAIIAGALERRVWTRIAGDYLFPNMMILLVGPPGVGKTQAIKHARSFWADAGDFNVAPSGMTKAAFIDQLVVKTRNFQYENKLIMMDSMLVGAPEFGTLVPDYDVRFLSVLNDAYDCLATLEDKTRGGGTISAQRPCLNLLSGTQPKYLGDKFPENAWGQGFTSRLIMVYAGDRVVISLFKSAKLDETLAEALLEDLKLVGALVGEFIWDPDAQEAVEEWNREIMEGAPTHPKLQDYNKRRIIHAIKLSMTIAIAGGRGLTVKLEDFELARDLLIEAEEVMPEIFKEMSTSQDATEINEIHEFMFNYCRRLKKDSIPQHTLVHFMVQRVPVSRITYFIDMMLTSNLMKVEGANKPGQNNFVPMRVSKYET